MAALRITHCAEDPRAAIDVMVNGTYNVFEAAIDAGVRKVVAASSASAYGLATDFPTTEAHHPYANDTLYGAAKVFLEGLLRSLNAMSGLDYVALRYFNVYGERMDIHGVYTEVLVRWMERIERGTPPLILGNGLQTMDFVNIEDVARATLLAAEADVCDEVFNVASGTETSLLDLAHMLLKVMGRADLDIEFGPERGVNKVPRRLADTSLAAERLGFEAEIGLEDGTAAPRPSGGAPSASPSRAGGVAMQIPFAKPHLTGREGALVAEVIASGWVSQGPKVRAFEEAFAARVGAAEAVATTSVHDGAAARAVRHTASAPATRSSSRRCRFIATANSVWQCGATPVFADIDPDTYNLDADAAERAITRRTKVIMPVHQVGLPADMDRFLELAERHGDHDRRGRRLRHRRDLQGPPDRLDGPAGLLLAASAQGHHHGRGRHDHARRLRRRRPAAQAARPRDGRLGPRAPRGQGRRHRALPRARLELAHDRHAGPARPLPARGPRLDPRAPPRARRALQRRDRAHARRLEAPFEPDYAVRTWQSYCVRVTSRSAVGRTELMRRLLRDGIPTRRGVMTIHEEPAYADAEREPAALRGRRARRRSSCRCSPT